MSDDPIDAAQALVDSLYASGDLSVDQADAITAGLGGAAALESLAGTANAETQRLEAALRQVAAMKTIKGARRVVADALGGEAR